MASSESVFAKIPQSEYLHETKHFFVVFDGYPVSPGHCLIVSKAMRADFFDLSQEERIELTETILSVRSLIDAKYAPGGYNLGMNCGRVAGQTVMHFHCHVIPRYGGDMAEPAGGVRHCVSGKGYYQPK
jgi:diadenosine tetraphosphate (Ap4A) HIT family hydrolase